MEVLEHSQVSKMGTIKSSNTMKYYSSTKKTGDSMRALEYPGKSCNYTTETEDGRRSREKRDQRKRRKRRTHRESSAKSHPRYSHSLRHCTRNSSSSSKRPAKRHKSVNEGQIRVNKPWTIHILFLKKIGKFSSLRFAGPRLRPRCLIEWSVDIDVDHWCEKI